MPGTYCTLVKKFDRGQLFRCCCVGCVHNTAHFGDGEMHCQYLEYRHASGEGRMPVSEPSVWIPPDLRG